MSVDEQVAEIKQAMVSAAVDAFFPDEASEIREFLERVSSHQMRPEFVDEAIKLAGWRGKEFLTRLEHFHGLAVWMSQSLGWWIGGLDPDVLQAFPGQRLIREQRDARPLWDAELRWRMHRGKDAQLIALKTDPIWGLISEFGLPFPPFALDDCWDVEDLDRAESERLGLLTPSDCPKPGQFKFSTEILVDTLKHAIRLRPWGQDVSEDR